jgi:hypothetical protein
MDVCETLARPAQNPAAPPPSPAEVQAIQLEYYRVFKNFPLLCAPRRFTEKIAWRKLYQRDPRFRVFADKYAVKQEVARLAGRQYVVETLWAGPDPAAIPFERLTPPYVIKLTHSSGGSIFVRCGDVIDPDKIREHLQRHLKYDHAAAYGEWGYQDIPRQVLIEPMIEMPGGIIPDDYKFYVYHGRVHFAQNNTDRFAEHRQTVFDRHWRPLPVKMVYPPADLPPPRPDRLEEMINLAEAVGAPFDFVRVDLYAPPQGVFFGEATFYPDAGRTEFAPEIWDDIFGAPWKV